MNITEANRPYQPFGAAIKLLYAKAPEIILCGPAGTGKSRADLEKLHLCAEKYPGMRGLIVRKTRASLTHTGLVTWEEKVVPQGHPILSGPAREQRSVYRYPNRSEIVVGGMDKAIKIMSSEYDMIVVLEATELTETDYEALTTRLRNGVMPYQQIIGDCNPDAPYHWLKRRADTRRCLMFDSRHEDNPTLFNHKTGKWTPKGELYLSKLDALTGVRYRRLRLGEWAAAEGIVYEEFDRAVHIIDRFDIPHDWSRYRVIDFGFNNPFVCQWWAQDPDGRLYRYKEIYQSKRIVEDHAKQINSHSEGHKFVATIADHDAEDRATLTRHGIQTIPATKALKPGIEAVQARLRVQADGRPRIFFLRDSLVGSDQELLENGKPFSTEHEFDSYVYPKGVDGKPIKEDPVKQFDHGMDAMRYLVAYCDLQTPPRYKDVSNISLPQRRI